MRDEQTPLIKTCFSTANWILCILAATKKGNKPYSSFPCKPPAGPAFAITRNKDQIYPGSVIDLG
jgi:hypothetical protein